MRFLLLFLLLAAPAHAACTGPNEFDALPPDEQAALLRATEAQPYSHGLIWQAEKPGSKVFVVGTMHIHDPRLDTLMQRVSLLLADSDALLLETRKEDELALQRRLIEEPELAFITEGPTLIDRLSGGEWKIIEEELQARGIPAFLGAKYRPWMLAMTLAVPPCAMADVAAGKLGLDRMIEAEAIARGMPVSSLDDTGALIDLLAGDPLEKQVADLQLSLSMGAFSQDYSTTLVDFYFREQPLLMWEFTRYLADTNPGADPQKAKESIEEMTRKLLVERNLSWAPKIMSAAEGRTILVAVGGMHLSGESGVLTSLEHAGYRVTYIPAEANDGD